MVVLEDFATLMDVFPSIVGHLQHIWDHQFNFPRTNAFLVLVGQYETRMIRAVLSSRAPLYGRATALLHLRPFPFAETQAVFPKYTPAERVAVYAILGGVPGYWEHFDPEQSLRENIRQCFLSDSHSFFQDEPAWLLREYGDTLPTYGSMLRALAQGRRTPAAIARQAGLSVRLSNRRRRLDRDRVAADLHTLMDAGHVVYDRPVTARLTTRARWYRLPDPFLRFHFRFLAARQDDRNGGQRQTGKQARALNTHVKFYRN